jgi:hypothetical protein
MDGMTSDSLIDYADGLTQLSGHEGEINLFDRAGGKLLRQAAMGFVVLGHDETTARILVEPVHDAGPLFPADDRQRGTMMEQCIDEGVFAVTGARVHDQTRCFVDDDEIVVFEENLKRDPLWQVLDLFQWRLGELNLIAASNDLAWPAR